MSTGRMIARSSNEVEEDRKRGSLQVVCYRAGVEFGVLEMVDRKWSKDYLLDSLTCVASGWISR